MNSQLLSAALAPEHQLEGFDCGKPDLNTWLVRSARHTAANNTARTFVWTPVEEPTRVVAYYSLAGHIVERSSMPTKLSRGSPDFSPAILLARLALDKTLHGQGLGGTLLAHALSRAARATQYVAARFLIVDAADESAVTFYLKYGFIRVPDDSRLYRKISDISRDIADASGLGEH